MNPSISHNNDRLQRRRNSAAREATLLPQYVL